MMPSVACSDSQPQRAQLGVLYLTALGMDRLMLSVSGFGSDQFDKSDCSEKN
jgi:hypothetical protein